jgi:hypothetical protein
MTFIKMEPQYYTMLNDLFTKDRTTSFIFAILGGLVIIFSIINIIDYNKIWRENKDNRSYFSSTVAIMMVILNALIILLLGAACLYCIYKSSKSKEDQSTLAAEIKFAVDLQREMILANSPPPKGQLPKVII